MSEASIMKRLIQGIENEPGMCCSAHPPAHDATGEGVDDKGHVNEALPGCDVGKIRNPKPV